MELTFSIFMSKFGVRNLDIKLTFSIFMSKYQMSCFDIKSSNSIFMSKEIIKKEKGNLCQSPLLVGKMKSKDLRIS